MPTFSQVSLFSGMNQPEDISFNVNYASLCGFKQNELETYFEPEINEFAKKNEGMENYLSKLKGFYNGYKFAKNADKVYNPISIMKHFGNDGDFRAFWAETGTPNFLAKFISRKGTYIGDLENQRYKPSAFANFKDDSIELVPLMYQAGYLTIADYEPILGTYKLKYPNAEVRSMLNINCDVEKHSAVGSVDSIVKIADKVYVIEMKLDKSIEEAMKQIEERKYYVSYLGNGNKVFKLGVVFGSEARNVVDWRCEEV